MESNKAKRDYTKFFTYPETADFMVSLLEPQDGDAILEPSAGNGALVKAIKKACPKSIVFAVEIDERWRVDLKAIVPRVIVIIKYFLELPDYAKFTSCLANPPFGNGTDLQAHFDRMRTLVKKGGRMVMLLPDDFDVKTEHKCYPLENWSTNKDGTTTLIKIVVFNN